jgi:hypothetical protein
MSRVEKLENEITELSPQEFSTLRDWIIKLDADAWDRQFEADVKAGKLDAAAKRALEDHAAGRSRKL